MIGLAAPVPAGGIGTALLSSTVTPGEFIVATATDKDGNTSEFSACTLVSPGSYLVDGRAGGAVNWNSPPPDGLPPLPTGVFVDASHGVTVSASGSVFNAPSSGPWGPAGHPSLVGDSTYLAPGLPAFALIGRVGGGSWVLIGAGPTVLSGDGFLELAVNDSDYDDNSGSFTVTVIQP